LPQIAAPVPIGATDIPHAPHDLPGARRVTRHRLHGHTATSASTEPGEEIPPPDAAPAEERRRTDRRGLLLLPQSIMDGLPHRVGDDSQVFRRNRDPLRGRPGVLALLALVVAFFSAIQNQNATVGVAIQDSTHG